MNLLLIVCLSGVILLIAYFTYGRLLARLLRLDPNVTTPAVELRDDVDYVPIEPKFLLGQHFSAIAAAGPIVGPIIAGVTFGWLPALVWILIGAIFIGGVHDITALTASIRHKARSIAEVVRDHMTARSYVLFLAFIWIALVYIIVAFTDVTAQSFVGPATEENGGVSGAAIATSSMLYLLLPIVMGLLLRYTPLSLGLATVIFLPLVGVVIWAGQYIPFDMTAVVNSFSPGLSDAESQNAAQKSWDILLLAYCLIAGVVPVWLLLQPRGHLGGYFLYAALAAGAIGIVFGNNEVNYPSFTDWSHPKVGPLFPMLFITIACGACSGFHSLIASGTTSKQLRKETDAKSIGYGAMLLEAMVAIIALATVMILAGDSSMRGKSPNIIYANGLGNFLSVLRIPPHLGVAFGLMAFTTFVYDTLDVCTRLGRYIIQELTGLHNTAGRWLGTALTAGVPVLFVMQTTIINGEVQPIWRKFWPLFGASNQLLAALTLLGVTVWLWKTQRAWWVWLVTGVPTVWMYVMSVWALVSMIRRAFADGLHPDPVPWISVVLVALAGLMLVEAVRSFVGVRPTPPPRPQVVPAGA